MAGFVDHYQVLGVHRHADPEVIKAAYRAMARRYHPDLNRTDPRAEEKLKAINAAYDILSDPRKRPGYNLDWDKHFKTAKKKKPTATTRSGNSSATGGMPPPPSPPPKQSAPHRASPPPSAAAEAPRARRPFLKSPLGAIFLVLLVISGINWVAGQSGVRKSPTRPASTQPTAARSVAIAVATSTPRPRPPTAESNPPTPRPKPTAVPTVQPTPPISEFPRVDGSAWGMSDSFDFGTSPASEPGGPTWTLDNGHMTLVTTASPNDIWWRATRVSSSGRDVRFRADVGRTTGSGSIVLLVADKEQAPVWAFYVDPTNQQWMVDRWSVQRNEFFEWVVPRSYAASQLGKLESIELRIENDVPALLVNGVDVAAAAGVRLESVPSNVIFGFGGAGSQFEVAFDAIELVELNP